MRKIVPLLLIVAAGMLAVSPFLINAAPYESTMGLVQKIFYYHVPSAMSLFIAAVVCGIASARVLFSRDAAAAASANRVALAAAELAIVFGLIVLVTGPLWARKAWGVWWVWEARLTSTLVMWLVFWSYLLVRRFGGPGSDKLAAAVGLFGMALVPFVYVSVNLWRTLHPKTTVISTLAPGMAGPFWFCVVAFLCLFTALLLTRVRLEEARDSLEDLIIAAED